LILAKPKRQGKYAHGYMKSDLCFDNISALGVTDFVKAKLHWHCYY